MKGGSGGGRSCLYWEIGCSSREDLFLKKLVPFSDSSAAEAPKDLCYVNYDVNQSQMVRILLCYTLVGEVAIFCSTV